MVANNAQVTSPSGYDQLWLGSVMEDQQDASGLLYRRNRYYDPATGRFTQEDPISLAGGLNLYGFANGDPVSYSDPYGLAAESTSGESCDPPTPCRITDWGGGGPGQTRGLGHVRAGHTGPGAGNRFNDMDDRALRHIISGTVEGGELVDIQPNGNRVFERTWGRIGTRGQRIARVLVDEGGALITAFPVPNAYNVAARRAAGASVGGWLLRAGTKIAAAATVVGIAIELALSPTPLGTSCEGGRLCQ